ncbi:MAG: NUDIX hydrolase [Spirochaetota bacterium]|nr:NUDIX hydrolase [Spirochaetota bacterium]
MKFGLSNKKIRIRVAGLVVEENKILLIAHKKGNEIYWLLPGGGVEYQESLDEALKREFFEELGLTVEVGDIALIADSIEPNGKRHIVNIAFWCYLNNKSIRLGDEKILYDFSFKPVSELVDIVMYPPLNGYIIQLLQNKNERIYKGSLWIP